MLEDCTVLSKLCFFFNLFIYFLFVSQNHIAKKNIKPLVGQPKNPYMSFYCNHYEANNQILSENCYKAREKDIATSKSKCLSCAVSHLSEFCFSVTKIGPCFFVFRVRYSNELPPHVLTAHLAVGHLDHVRVFEYSLHSLFIHTILLY